MKNFQDDRFIDRLIHSKIVLLIFLCFVVFFLYNVIRFSIKAFETRENKVIAQEKVTNLQKEKDRLNLEIERLNTDAGVEENIRNKFALAKDGEGLIVVLDDDTPQTQKTKLSFWARIRNLFK
ncbi:MAG: septum formation initiator family protein [Patescibacteria group bacterium]